MQVNELEYVFTETSRSDIILQVKVSRMLGTLYWWENKLLVNVVWFLIDMHIGIFLSS